MNHLLAKHARVVECAAGDRSSGGNIRQQQRPCGDCSKHRRQRACRVSVERAGRRREPRKTADADADHEDGDGGEEINEPRGATREREHQWNGERGRSGGRNGGDRLRKSLNRTEHTGVQIKLFAGVLAWGHLDFGAGLAQRRFAFQNRAANARWLPRCSRAARQWEQKYGLDYLARTGSGPQADDAD